MELKVAEYNDFKRIAQLHTESWKKYYQGILGKEYLDNEVLEDRLVIWQTRLTNPPYNQHVLMLEDNGMLCGFICAFGNHDFEKGTMIDAIHVSDAFRGRGLGVRLLEEMAKWIEQYFPESGVYLEVLKNNTQAIEFYEHIGGKNTLERLWKAPCGTELTELVYTWHSAADLRKALQSHKKCALVTN